jgi:gamma-glutamyl:cysteine ligase YbdK (ATP-grasp superfamily)
MTRTGPLEAFAGYGIELEYMIVDAATLDVRPLAPALLAALEEDDCGEAVPGLAWSNEIVAHVVEVKNVAPTASLGALAEGFNAEIARANRLLRPLGARLMPGAMHPWMNPLRETHLWPDDPEGIYGAYHRIFDCRAHGWSNVQSMHLNFPFRGDAEFARLHAAIRLIAPIVPALAASSPVTDGVPSPHLDARLQACATNAATLPSIAGRMVPEPVRSRAEYEARILAPMYREIRPLDPSGTLQKEWLNSRAAIARFDRSAIELRVFDVQECPCADVAIAVAVIAAVRRLWDADADDRDAALPTDALAAILARCTAVGERAVIADRAYLDALGFPGERATAGALWGRLIERAPECATEPWRKSLATIGAGGPLARRVLTALGDDPSRARQQAVWAELCDCLAGCCMFEGVRAAEPTPGEPK